MLEAATYLGTSLFFCLLILLVYWYYKQSKQKPIKPIAVPLRIDRTLLLEKQRLEVASRRNRLKTSSNPESTSRSKQPDATRSSPVTEEPTDSGFGEDLGWALSREEEESLGSTDKPKQNRNTGRSRFAALQEAADQFKEIYNRNSQL